MRRNSYFIRLLSFNIILVIVSVFMLGYIAYLKTTSLINEKIDKINGQLLFQTQLQIENSLRSVESAIVQFSLSPNLINIMDVDFNVIKYENYLELKSLLPEINTLYSHDSGFSYFEIVNLNKGWVLRNGGVLAIQEVYSPDEIRRIKEGASSSIWSRVDNGNFEYTLKVPFSSFDQFNGVVRARIPGNEIYHVLATGKDMGEMTLIDANGSVIRGLIQFKSIQDELADAVQKVQRDIQIEPEGSFLTKLNGDEYSVIYRKSAKYGWTYLSVVSTLETNSTSRFIGFFIVITSFVVISVIFVFSLFGARKLYSPIKRLFHLVVSNSDDNSHARSNELDFINKKIRMFLQDSQRLKAQLGIKANELNDFFAFKLFQGELKQTEIESKLGIDMRWEQYCVMTVQIDTLEGTGYRKTDLDLLLFAVKNMLGELAAELSVLRPVIINNVQVLLIGTPHKNVEVMKEDVYLLSRSIQQAVKQYLKLQVSIGISDPFFKSYEASDGYHKAADALKLRMTHGREAILYISDFDETEAVKAKYPALIAKDLNDAIKFGDKEQTKHFLHNFIAEIFSGPYSYKDCHKFIFLLLMDMIKLSNNSDEMFIRLFKEKPLFDYLDQLLQNSGHDVEVWIYDTVIEPMITETLARNETRHRNITKTLIQFIHEEYDTDLTLEACASRLHFNPNYLGQIFRKESGSGFNDYLSQYRLIISKKMLAETDYQVQEIAENLRFSNSQNFIRYFKKMEGITPRQYRENLMKS
ncbi:AraC family transcriptional regulator [Paenibacillus piri]|nr:AraC family transcriptional regulator [Paenibacillus piri]